MKIVKESIANLERCIENDKVDAVGSMPITMADAFYQSQKNDKRLEDVMKETDDVPELEKVIGAEKQPVPKKPEEPKVTLEESLFEEDEEDFNDSVDALSFYSALEDLKNAFSAVNDFVTDARFEFDDAFADGYPFDKSFDELTFEVMDWVEGLADVLPIDSQGEMGESLKESYDIPSRDKVAKFIEDSKEELLSSEDDGGCCRLVLDDDLCLYVGWESGFDKDNGHDGWEVCAKIAERNDYDWADFEFLNMPWSSDDGEVWDTSVSNPDASDADWFIKSYEGIRDALDNNEIVLESLKKSRSKRLVEADSKKGGKVYVYKGKAHHFEKELDIDDGYVETTAPSKAKAISNIKAQIKVMNGLPYNAKVDIDEKKVKEVKEDKKLKEGKGSKPFVDQEGNVYTDEDRSGGLDSSKDLWTIIYNELAPEHSNWRKRTKIKDIPTSKRYDYNDIEFDYDDNILIHADSEDDFELARRVADAYGLEFRNPRKRAYDVDLVGTIVMPKNK